MKELSEYTAEVMRRADEKKRARKRAAIRTVTLCVPLALAATAALVLLPRVNKPGADVEAALPTQDVPDGMTNEAAASFTVFVEPIAQDAEFVEAHETAMDESDAVADPALKEELIAIIDGVVNGEESADDEVVDAEFEGYYITISGSDGGERRYALKPLTLTDLDLGIEYRITEEQYERLLALIRGT